MMRANRKKFPIPPDLPPIPLVRVANRLLRDPVCQLQEGRVPWVHKSGGYGVA